MKTLIVYFSRTGYTRKIAEEIARGTGAEVEAIRDVRSRSGIFGYLRSAREAYKKRVVEIRAPTNDPADYDLVILGTPVWASNVSSPMRAYLSHREGALKRAALFCTEGGRGAEKVLRDLSELCGQQPVASLILKDREIKTGTDAAKVAEFVEAIRASEAA